MCASDALRVVNQERQEATREALNFSVQGNPHDRHAKTLIATPSSS